ncbi:MAG: ERCC4 domain-containing protein [Sulfolobales archaeon]|nr:helix-hairpin-helix domain-containing protein [Sulfolobales archaeon]MCX8185848.1 helix-hairpin-helix domain-containing protein [Sulfolobales archaeon]MDW7969105.1 ERCC4 domain-containing protein [Sulfolobales archaeon]
MKEDGWRNAHNMVKIYVDEREKSSGIPDILNRLGLTIIYKMLEVGDYVISDSLVIERKRVDDLVRSVFDGRFFEQMSKLSEVCEIPMIIVEGDLNDIRYLTSKWKSIEGALLTAIINFGVIPYYTKDLRHTADVIRHVAEKFSNVSSFKSYFRRTAKPKDEDVRSWQLYILQSLPGVGVKTAHKLLEKFSNVRSVFNASLSELSMIEGISDEKAGRIIKVITEPYVKKSVSSNGLSKYVNSEVQERS